MKRQSSNHRTARECSFQFYFDKETRVQFLGQEDLLEEEMATHSSITIWEIHGQRSLVGLYSPGGHEELDTT